MSLRLFIVGHRLRVCVKIVQIKNDAMYSILTTLASIQRLLSPKV